jgi:hypothetical protein
MVPTATRSPGAKPVTAAPTAVTVPVNSCPVTGVAPPPKAPWIRCRLIAWLRLERRPTGRLTDSPDDKPKLEAIARAQAAGRVRPGDPADLFAMVLAMACTWSPASGFYTATADEPASEHERRRSLLRDCVLRAVTP